LKEIIPSYGISLIEDAEFLRSVRADTAGRSEVADGMNASFIILPMSFGLIVPKLIIDHLPERPAPAES